MVPYYVIHAKYIADYSCIAINRYLCISVFIHKGKVHYSQYGSDLPLNESIHLGVVGGMLHG